MNRAERLAEAAAAYAERVREAGGDASEALARADAARDATAGAIGDEPDGGTARRARGEQERAAQRTEGALTDWTRLGTRRGVTPEAQVRSAWTVVGDPDNPEVRALANVLLSAAAHAGRVADVARNDSAVTGAARRAAARTARRNNPRQGDLPTVGEVLDREGPRG